MDKKVCPILQAGAEEISPYCMKEDCEWYEHGCPAYPKHELTQEEIDDMIARKRALGYDEAVKLASKEGI